MFGIKPRFSLYVRNHNIAVLPEEEKKFHTFLNVFFHQEYKTFLFFKFYEFFIYLHKSNNIFDETREISVETVFI